MSARVQGFLNKFGYLALLGFAAIMLTGPVIALMALAFSIVVGFFSVLLPFAVMGLILWLPIRAVTDSPSEAWREASEAVQKVWRNVLEPPYLWFRRFFAWIKTSSNSTRTFSMQIGGILLETICGAAVGAMIGVAAEMGKETIETDAALCAAVGAAIGLFVGFSRIQRNAAVLAEEPAIVT